MDHLPKTNAVVLTAKLSPLLGRQTGGYFERSTRSSANQAKFLFLPFNISVYLLSGRSSEKSCVGNFRRGTGGETCYYCFYICLFVKFLSHFFYSFCPFSLFAAIILYQTFCELLSLSDLMLWYFQVNKVTGRLKVVVWKFTRSPKISFSISQVIATFTSSSSSSLLPFFLVVSTQYV